MSSEIQQAIESGKLSSAAGNALEKLKPGAFVTHKSWGFGQIGSVNFLINQMTIDFRSKKGHVMQLQYAAESLAVVPQNHILAQKAMDLAGVKERAKTDPVWVIRIILESFGGKASQDQIAAALVPDVFTETEFKRWFETTKKALKKDGHFTIPSKKSEPFELRAGPVSHADEYISAFAAARQLKDQINAIELIQKNLSEFNDPASQLAPVIQGANDTCRRNVKLKTAESLSLLLSRDELIERAGMQNSADAPTVAGLLREEERQLTTLLGEVPVSKLKRVTNELPGAFGDDWVPRAVQLVLRGNTRVVTEVAKLLQDKGAIADLRTALERAISGHSISSDALNWLCREREGQLNDLATPRVLGAILSALERDQHNEKRDRKLHDLLLNDKELVTDLLADASPEELREIMRTLLLTPVFEELNKRSLLGRIIRVYPDLQSMVTGDGGDKHEALIVSWESLERRKTEYEELVTKKIPENTKEIQIARSYGDLRENFEFKAAKEMQRVLMRRQAETQRDLANARGTDFANPDTAQVSIGTIVTVREVPGGKEHVYTILGAWDGDPEKGIISYQAAIAQALIGHKIGEQLRLPAEDGECIAEIVRIEAYKK